jgi:undecaprenyl-diphosphatase
LATPTVVGAFLYSSKDIAAHDINFAFLLGIIFSLIFGLISIKYLLKYLEKGNFAIFTWYRILFGILILGVYFLRKF